MVVDSTYLCASTSVRARHALRGVKSWQMELVLEILAECPAYQNAVVPPECTAAVQLLGNMLCVKVKAVRRHAHMVCQWHATVLAERLYACYDVPTPLLQSIVHGVCVQLRRDLVNTRAYLHILASLEDVLLRDTADRVLALKVQDRIVSAVGTSMSEDYAIACVCGHFWGVMHPHVSACAEVCRLLPIAARQNTAYMQLQVATAVSWLIPGTSLVCVPSPVLRAHRDLAVCDWDALRAAGVWVDVLALVRLHMRRLLLDTVQASLFLRDAEYVWVWQLEHARASERCMRDYLDMILDVTGAMSRKKPTHASVAAFAAVAHAVGVVFGTLVHLAPARCWEGAWVVVQHLHTARASVCDDATYTEAVEKMLHAHVHTLRAHARDVRELLRCVDLRTVPMRARVHLVHTLAHWHATEPDGSRRAHVLDAAARVLAEVDCETFETHALDALLADVGAGACAAFVSSFYMPNRPFWEHGLEAFAPQRFAVAVMHKLAGLRQARLSTAWLTCMRDFSLTFNHMLADEHTSMGVPYLMSCTIEFVCVLIMLLRRGKLRQLHISGRVIERIIAHTERHVSTMGIAAAYIFQAAAAHNPAMFDAARVFVLCKRVPRSAFRHESAHLMIQGLSCLACKNPEQAPAFFEILSDLLPALSQRLRTKIAICHTVKHAPACADFHAVLLAYMCPPQTPDTLKKRECQVRAKFLESVLAVVRAPSAGHALEQCVRATVHVCNRVLSPGARQALAARHPRLFAR